MNAHPARPPRAVFLDAGGVLQLPTSQPILDLLARIGVAADEEDLRRAHYNGMRAIDTHREDGRVYERYRCGYLATFRIPEDDAERAESGLAEVFDWNGSWRRPVPGAIEALRTLATRPIPIVIVSNAEGTLAGRLADEAICQVGDGQHARVAAILDSTVVGVEKPSPEIFEMALRAAVVTADEAIHVGDSVYFDIEGARNAGVEGIHFDPFGMCDCRDHGHVAGLDEIDALFRAGAPATTTASSSGSGIPSRR